jgi:DNA-binding LacI/PurR family transcriptional regulator
VDNPWGVTAHSVTEWAWQQRIHKNLPKPLIGANPFAAARSMAQQLLDAGHRAEAIARVYAANDGAWTLQALQHLLREQPPSPSRPQPAPYRPDPTVADFGDAAAKARQLRKTLRRQVDDPPTAV